MATEHSTYTHEGGVQETVTLKRGPATPHGHAVLKIKPSIGPSADCYVNTAWLRDRLDDLGEPRRTEPRDEREHIGTEGEIDWHGMYLAENRRAEKAERERDKARGALRVRLGVLAEPHPLTPDAITDEMVKRTAHCIAMQRMPITYSHDPDHTAEAFYDDARAVLTAALTEPPARPEGAERWETWLSRLDYLHDETGASRTDLTTLANDLAAHLTDPTRKEA